jgi:hypothetical protein
MLFLQKKGIQVKELGDGREVIKPDRIYEPGEKTVINTSSKNASARIMDAYWEGFYREAQKNKGPKAHYYVNSTGFFTSSDLDGKVFEYNTGDSIEEILRKNGLL